jgi:hypothetical protein
VARKKADIPSTEFHQQNAVLTTPLEQSRVWMEIKGQGKSGQVSVGEETTLLIKALLPGEEIMFSQIIMFMIVLTFKCEGVSNMDIKCKTCDIRTQKRHLFFDISSTDIDTLVPTLYQCAETCNIGVF